MNASTLPAIQSPNRNLTPSTAEWAMLKEQVGMYVRSGFLSGSVKTPEQGVTIAMKGWELGIPPMQSFAHINVINGKPAISSELMLALIYTKCPGAVVNFLRSDDTGCELEARRPGAHTKFSKFSFNEADATKAKLLGKGNWATYPTAMFRARAISAMARAMFPDALMGCSYTPEELDPDVRLDDEGSVIETTGTRETPPPAAPKQAAAPKAPPAPIPPGQFVIKIGPLSDKKLKDIPLDKLESYVAHYKQTDRAKLSPQQTTALTEMIRAIDGFIEDAHMVQSAPASAAPTSPADAPPLAPAQALLVKESGGFESTPWKREYLGNFDDIPF